MKNNASDPPKSATYCAPTQVTDTFIAPRAAEGYTHNASRPAGSYHPDTTTASILIIDHDPVHQQTFRDLLSGGSCTITLAGSGAAAVRMIRAGQRFDLVLLDIEQAGKSDFGTCRQIREQYLPSELPIILVTDQDQVEALEPGLALGANDYLGRPFTKTEFLARVKTQLNLKRINGATARFVPNEFLKAIGRDNFTEVQLGDYAEKIVTVLFSDIRDYTGLSEGMTPAENFKFVNAFHGRMGPIIREMNGFVNQYLGDGIMAIFPGSPADALRAAVKMQQALQVYNEERSRKYRKPISIGIGMHTGPLIMGIIGDRYRMDAATISDTVNTAARIESLTKHYGASILLSKACLKKMPDKSKFNLRYLGKVKVKGKARSTGLYECFDGNEPELVRSKRKIQRDFETGMKYFLAKAFPEAILAFKNILRENKNDFVAHYFYRRSATLALSGVPDNWSGVEEMQKK